jgi:outer membrane protein
MISCYRSLSKQFSLVLVLALSALPPSAWSQSSGAPQPLTQADIVQMALQRSADLRRAQIALSTAELSRRNAWSDLLPSVEFSSSHGWQGQRLDGPTQKVSQWGLSLSAPLYDNGRRWRAVKRQESEFERSQLGFRLSRDQALRSVLDTYWSVIAAQLAKQAATDQVDLTRRQYRTVETQLRSGMTLRADLSRIQAVMSRAELNLESASIELEKSLLELKRLLNHPLDQDLPVLYPALESPQVADDLEARLREGIRSAEAAAKERSPLQATQDLIRQVEDLAVVEAERAAWPSLNINLNWGWSNSDHWADGRSLFDGAQSNWSALVGLNATLWNWGQNWRSVQIARLGRESTELRLQAETAAERIEFQTASLSLREDLRRLRIVRDLLRLEQENYRTTERSYRQGRLSVYSLSKDLEDLAAARSQYISFIVQAEKTILRLNAQRGRLYELLAK